VTLLSWVIFGLWLSLLGLIEGVVRLDFEIQGSPVFHQHVIHALQPETQSRLDKRFACTMFIGGALGPAGASEAWRPDGWSGVSRFEMALGAIAAPMQGRRLRIRHQ